MGAVFEVEDHEDHVRYALKTLRAPRRHRSRLIKAEFRAVRDLAKKLKLWVVLGSDHRLSAGNKPHNSLYVISPKGEIVDRYDKRFCTGGDPASVDFCERAGLDYVSCSPFRLPVARLSAAQAAIRAGRNA